MADIEPDQIPLPRDSLVSVRLSDADAETNVMLPDADAVDEDSVEVNSDASTRTSSSRFSHRSSHSSSTDSVNWEGLEKTEEQEPRDQGTDESTALLLARLEQENNALAHNPKAGIAVGRARSDTRPPSIHQLKKLVNGPHRQSLRYSLLPAPPMTELEFWAALVKDYPQTCQRLPTLTSNKIRGGVPPPLRGVVWAAIAGAHDGRLHSEYQRLSNEHSPYDGLIGKDVGRSFPNVEMFREPGGEGQLMLGRVLKAFSLYDEGIGYCQGLGLIVGPLLMHMCEAEAFCVLVRLMEHYDLRSCYTPDLAGLHLRIYQFQALLSKLCPEISAHLHGLKIEPLYVSQWFLSFFAVTCPLPMLLRIYDVILSEGATETLMRVALALMQRNEKKILAFCEFEDAMQFLLSRGLWDTYAQHADDMVTDFVSLTGLVSRESLQTLENDFAQAKLVPATSTLKNAAASLLGRFWAGAAHVSKAGSLTVAIPKSPNENLHKTSSAQSLRSTFMTTGSSASDTSTAPTELSETLRLKSDAASVISLEVPALLSTGTDRDLHQQIEELLTALSKLQHQHLQTVSELQKEREDRAEERNIASSLLDHLTRQQASVKELIDTDEEPSAEETALEELTARAQARFMDVENKRISIHQSKHQLREDVTAWKEKHDLEAAKCRDLMKQLDDREIEHNALKEHLREARSRIQNAQRDKQRLEKNVSELRSRQSIIADSPADLYSPVNEVGELKFPGPKGLREFKLGRPQSPPVSMVFSKRSSSLQPLNAIPADDKSLPTDSILLELAMAKTAEAVARQELEETKNKLDALRKIISGPVTTPGPKVFLGDSSPASTGTVTPSREMPKADSDTTPKVAHGASSSIGGFFSGWTKRAT